MPEKNKQIHNISPVYDSFSRILILGSFPSEKSRESGFFYGHPQNRFWRVISSLYGEGLPLTIDEKKNLLISHGIALWDVLAQCEIKGSSDSSIQNAIPNDLSEIVKECDIGMIFTNGKTADSLYRKFLKPQTNLKAVCLPSTSPANASWNLERLCEAWKTITEYTK